MHWQHTRCRISRYTEKPIGDNVHQLIRISEYSYEILHTLHAQISAGNVAGIAVAAVMSDRTSFTAFDAGTCSHTDMIGVCDMLKHRLLIKMD